MANEKILIDLWSVNMEEVDTSACTDTEDILSAVITYLVGLPTVDAVEVVHGQWEDFCGGKMCCCSACKAEFDNTCNDIHGEWHYCPNCGAKMDGDADG